MMTNSLKKQQQELQNRLQQYAEKCATPYPAIEAILLSAAQNLPLTTEVIMEWQKLLSPQPQQIATNHLMNFLEKINQTLANLKTPSQIVSYIADLLIDFHSLQHHTQMEQLLANYAALRLRIPLLLFPSQEDHLYREALENSFNMRLYLSKKVKDCIFDATGGLLFMDKDYDGSALYRSSTQEGLEIVEWHELNQAMEKWRNLLDKK